MVCAPPDPAHMAQEFLRQWQKHITQTMTDPATIRAGLEAMQQFYTAPASEPPNDARPRRPAPAPDAHDDAIRHLTQRVERLEQSIRRLAAALDAAQEPARAKHGRVAKPVAAKQRPAKRAAKPVAKPKRKPKK